MAAREEDSGTQAAKKPAAKKMPKKSRKKQPKKAAAKKPAAKKAARKKSRQKKPAAKKATAKKAPAKKEAPKAKPAPIVVRASSRYVRVAPRKARLVADQVRGLHIDQARALLAVLAARRRAGHRQADRVGRRQRREQPRPGRRRDAGRRDHRRRRPDPAPLPAAGARPGDPDQQANQPHRRGAEPRKRTSRHGTEDPSRRLPRRLHPGLEVELVRRERLRRRARRGPRRSAITSKASSRTPASPTSRSSAAARSRWTSTPPAPAS